jgi:hypothetical protein
MDKRTPPPEPTQKGLDEAVVEGFPIAEMIILLSVWCLVSVRL